MTKTELVESIRSIIREEVRSQLPNLLVEILAEKVSSTPNRSVVTEQRRVEVAKPAAQPAPRKTAPTGAEVLKNVKNPALRAVLSQTIGGIPGESSMPMVSSDMPIVSRTSIPKELIAENAALAAVDDAMKKDYRGLLKAMDKNRRGVSNINFSQPVGPLSFEQEPD